MKEENVWMAVFYERKEPTLVPIYERTCLSYASWKATEDGAVRVTVGIAHGPGEESFCWTWGKPFRVS